MMVFIDPISDFINGHPEMKMLALTFIVAIGALLVIDSAGFHTGIELLHMPLEKLMVYFAMVFCIVLEVVQMRYNKNLAAWQKECWKADPEAQMEKMRVEMLGETQHDEAAKEWAKTRSARKRRACRAPSGRLAGRSWARRPEGSAHAGAFLVPPA